MLHAGFYYSPDSLKAKLTWKGNQLLTAYCEEKGIPLNKCGKLVVARDRSEHTGLDELLRRGRANGIPLESISEKDAKTIEPRVKTCERALFSSATSTVDPSLVMQAMKKDALDEGIQLHCGVRYLSFRNQQVKTSEGAFDAEVILHEYVHLLTTRRVGNGAGLSSGQALGLAEGWSDFLALCLLSQPGDDLGGAFPFAAFSTYQWAYIGAPLTQNYHYGMRRYPYSTNLLKNPLTFNDLDWEDAAGHLAMGGA